MKARLKTTKDMEAVVKLTDMFNSINRVKKITFSPADESLEEFQVTMPDYDIFEADYYIDTIFPYLMAFVNIGGGIIVRIFDEPREKVFGIKYVDREIFVIPKEITKKCCTTCSDCGATIPDDGSEYIDLDDILALYGN